MLSFGCSPAQWLATAEKDLPVVLQIVTSVLQVVAAASGGAVSPALLTEVSTGGKEAQADLALIQTLVAEFQKSGDTALVPKIQAAINEAQTHLTAILAAFHVKDAALQATVSAGVGLALTTLLEIESLLPASAAKGARAVKPQSPSELRKEFNAIVTANGHAEAKIR